ncbi:zinc finger protein [Macleaya cordata]|uniref:Zinc finger protein n=1 Tax=Macleaya cordata TaxID=56857 RepID=A0A200QR26_MACCD|nr:zinc finger protein [Macleaya cordata]
MSATSTSGSATASATSEDVFRLSPSMNSSDLTESSNSSVTQAFPFSSGNPRIEEIRGIMHLYREDISSAPSNLPVGRKPLICVLAVPNHMTYADFCQFCGSFIQHTLEMRIVRNDGMEDQYSVLIRFDSQDSADNFYKHFNGKRFSSMEVEVCRVLFTVDVQYTASIEHAHTSPASSTEQPSCPVCLERLDQDMGGILTTICNHSFHCSCISKWTDSSCPVCRYCQQQPEKSKCSVCETSENLWICVICGFVGCGRYKEGHAIRHWKETQHCYSLELETRRVWDYVGDNYVHRLIQSKTDGKLVELNVHCMHADDDCGSCECNKDSGTSEALFNSKVETIVNEYNDLLTSQLENQRIYFESLLLEAKEETEKEIAEAVDKAVSLKLQKMQAKLDKYVEEKKFLDEVNENLMKNHEIWKAKILEIEEREKKALKLKDEKIEDLEEQLRDLMVYLEAEKTVEQVSTSSEIKDGMVLPISLESSRKNTGNASRSNNRRRN